MKFICLYTKQKEKKRKTWNDGILHINPSTGSCQLFSNNEENLTQKCLESKLIGLPELAKLKHLAMSGSDFSDVNIDFESFLVQIEILMQANFGGHNPAFNKPKPTMDTREALVKPSNINNPIKVPNAPNRGDILKSFKIPKSNPKTEALDHLSTSTSPPTPLIAETAPTICQKVKPIYALPLDDDLDRIWGDEEGGDDHESNRAPVSCLPDESYPSDSAFFISRVDVDEQQHDRKSSTSSSSSASSSYLFPSERESSLPRRDNNAGCYPDSSDGIYDASRTIIHNNTFEAPQDVWNFIEDFPPGGFKSSIAEPSRSIERPAVTSDVWDFL